MNIIVTDEIQRVCPGFVGAAVEANVKNSEFCPALWDEINALGKQYRNSLTTETVNLMPSIAATRKVYKACG